jgi:hypothetical protein
VGKCVGQRSALPVVMSPAGVEGALMEKPGVGGGN